MTPEKPSITHFLTDGSLVELCSALADITAARVRLTNNEGVQIRRSADGRGWTELPAEADSPVIAAAIAHSSGTLVRPDGHALTIVPISAQGKGIGAIVLDVPASSADSELFEHIERVALSVAMTAGEFCTDELALRQRNAEQSVLYRLSSLLVGSTDLDSTFHIALRSAAEFFGADAGCVYTFEPGSQELTLRAEIGLCESLCACLASLPATEIVDREALDGEVVLIEDLIKDGNALHLEAISNAGFRGMLSSGITYQNKRLGLLRLYSREALASDRPGRALFRAISEQVAAAIAAAQSIEHAREHRALKRQLKLAADVQRRMLPRKTPDTPGLDVAARYEASFELGGDFYDIVDLEGSTGIIIGDVVGKGVAAALLMSATRAFIRAHLRREPSIARAVERVNRALVRDTLDNEFVTALLVSFDHTTRELRLCSAGHDPPLLARIQPDGTCSVTDIDPELAAGMALGIDDAQQYGDAPVTLEPGDVIVASTDGAHEAMNFDGKKYGRKQFSTVIADMLTQRPNATAREIVDHLVWEVRRFTGLAQASDDITIVVMRVLPDADAQAPSPGAHE